MRKLDNRGAAAWEFMLVAMPLFTLIFVIFDLGRYAITVQSLQTLADAGARAVMINWYTPQKTASTCNASSYLPSAAAEKTAAPFLFFGGLSPSLNAAKGASS
jgi:Flp pilus assembly protein TadG